MKKKKKIFEGKTKKLYETDDPEQLVLEFKDDVITPDGKNKGSVSGKGVINNQISAYLFEYLNGFNVTTHFIKNLGNRDMLVKRLDIIPIEIVIHNIAAGSLCKRYGLEISKELDYPITEFFLKDDSRRNPMINTSHAISFGHAKIDDIRTMERLTSKINAVLKSFFTRRNLKLINFKLEFGYHKNKLVLGDEMSLDTFLIWDEKTDEKPDQGYLQANFDNLETIYEEIKQRIFQN